MVQLIVQLQIMNDFYQGIALILHALWSLSSFPECSHTNQEPFSQCLVLSLHLLIRPYTLLLNLNNLSYTSSAPIPEIAAIVIGPITSSNVGDVLSCERVRWLIELDY